MFLILQYDIQQSGQKSTRCWFNFILNSAAAIGPSQKQTQIRVGCLAGKKELTKINFNAAFFFSFCSAFTHDMKEPSFRGKVNFLLQINRFQLCFDTGRHFASVGCRSAPSKTNKKLITKSVYIFIWSRVFFSFFWFPSICVPPKSWAESKLTQQHVQSLLDCVLRGGHSSEETLSRLITLPSYKYLLNTFLINLDSIFLNCARSFVILWKALR